MIAFDLDGVLIPDCDQIPNLGDLTAFYNLTTHMRPLFRPWGKWIIITARDSQYESITNKWIDKYFTNKPDMVLHKTDAFMHPTEYKAQLINKMGITRYIESDPVIVSYLLAHTTASIIHFDDFCAKHFL